MRQRFSENSRSLENNTHSHLFQTISSKIYTEFIFLFEIANSVHDQTNRQKTRPDATCYPPQACLPLFLGQRQFPQRPPPHLQAISQSVGIRYASNPDHPDHHPMRLMGRNVAHLHQALQYRLRGYRAGLIKLDQTGHAQSDPPQNQLGKTAHGRRAHAGRRWRLPP